MVVVGVCGDRKCSVRIYLMPQSWISHLLPEDFNHLMRAVDSRFYRLLQILLRVKDSSILDCIIVARCAGALFEFRSARTGRVYVER